MEPKCIKLNHYMLEPRALVRVAMDNARRRLRNYWSLRSESHIGVKVAWPEEAETWPGHVSVDPIWHMACYMGHVGHPVSVPRGTCMAITWRTLVYIRRFYLECSHVIIPMQAPMVGSHMAYT